jgi:hypothetical protein
MAMSEGLGLDGVDEVVDFNGLAARVGGQVHGDATFAGARVRVAGHPDYGITSGELAEAQRRFTNYARMRLLSVGSRQYDLADRQGFEDMEPARILLELRQELADAVNYLTFIDVQLDRWSRRLEDIR